MGFCKIEIRNTKEMRSENKSRTKEIQNRYMTQDTRTKDIKSESGAQKYIGSCDKSDVPREERVLQF